MAKKNKKSKEKNTRQKFGIIISLILIIASILSFYSWFSYTQEKNSSQYIADSIKYRNEIVGEVFKLSESIRLGNDSESIGSTLTSISLLSKRFDLYFSSSDELLSPEILSSNKKFVEILSQIIIDTEALVNEKSNVEITSLIADFNDQTRLLIEEQKVINKL